MKRSYNYDPSRINENGKDRMRFELGDTMVEGEQETCALSDEEYEAVISMHKKWKRAKLACLESIYRRFAYEPDTKTGPLQLSLMERAKVWKDDYEKLKKELDQEACTGMPEYGLDENGNRKDPYFHTDMMQNKEAGYEAVHVHAPW